jgi:hypothetical protein
MEVRRKNPLLEEPRVLRKNARSCGGRAFAPRGLPLDQM